MLFPGGADLPEPEVLPFGNKKKLRARKRHQKREMELPTGTVSNEADMSPCRQRKGYSKKPGLPESRLTRCQWEETEAF